MPRGKTDFLLFFSFIGGIFTASFFAQYYYVSIPLFIISLLLFLQKQEKRLFYFVLYSLIFSAIFFASFNYFLNYQNRVLKKEFYFENKSFLVKVLDEPREREKNIFVKVKILEEEGFHGLYKNIALYLPTDAEINYGDMLKIQGKIQTPQNTGNFNYRQYLNKENIGLVSVYPKFEIINKKQYENFFEKIKGFALEQKQNFKEKIKNNLSQDTASLLNSIVWGYKSDIPKDLSDNLSKVGLRHITAISGLHITLISTLLMESILLLGFWRRQAFLLSVVLVSFYVFLLGFPPSAVRAAIMGGLFLLSQNIGKPTNLLNPVLLAATVMLLFNPLLLKYDIGFQLSFLAVLGIIFWSNFIKDKLKILFFNNENYFLNIISLSISAQIFTIPLVAFYFGIVSLVFLISNLIILPLLPLILFFGFLGSIIPYGEVFLITIWPIVKLIVLISDFFSSLNFSFLNIQNLPLMYLVLIYTLLVILTYFVYKKYRFSSVKI
ncbi:ComE operon protein 3 [bacterium HR34]|nr:ComE operon protein 3 [bacterium HR34]